MKKRILYASEWAIIALIWMFFDFQGGGEGLLAGKPLIQVLQEAYGTWENALRGIIPAVAFFIVRYNYKKNEEEQEREETGETK